MSLADRVIDALLLEMPPVLRWAGAVAKRLRYFDIALEGKSSGSSNTDALTLADLTLQELIVAALRDGNPVFRECRIEAEEETGDLAAFPSESPITLALDPIDGTKTFRDRTGDGYCVMLHARTKEEMLASLVFLPEMGPHGTWVQVARDEVRCGADDPRRTAHDVLSSLPPIDPATRGDSSKIYLIGFQSADPQRAKEVTGLGLEGVAPDDMPGSIYPLLATGAFGGSLIHSPNIYDFPVSAQIARAFGGEAVWVHNGERVNFHEMWMDDRADMLRLPGIVACAVNPETRAKLAHLAKDWNPERYPSN
ncbi:MAG: inositol monophosphatase family protein [Planctomycetaceae bacterium]